MNFASKNFISYEESPYRYTVLWRHTDGRQELKDVLAANPAEAVAKAIEDPFKEAELVIRHKPAVYQDPSLTFLGIEQGAFREFKDEHWDVDPGEIVEVRIRPSTTWDRLYTKLVDQDPDNEDFRKAVDRFIETQDKEKYPSDSISQWFCDRDRFDFIVTPDDVVLVDYDGRTSDSYPTWHEAMTAATEGTRFAHATMHFRYVPGGLV